MASLSSVGSGSFQGTTVGAMTPATPSQPESSQPPASPQPSYQPQASQPPASQPPASQPPDQTRTTEGSSSAPPKLMSDNGVDLSFLVGHNWEPGHWGEDIFNNPNTQPFPPGTNYYYG